jgi:hypothetical protein
MASYTVQLTPGLVNQNSEGSLDTSVRNGISGQRTMESVLMVVGEGDRKQLYRLADGEVYSDDIEEPAASGIPIGNPEFDSGSPVVSVNNVTVGHPTASNDTGSTL